MTDTAKDLGTILTLREAAKQVGLCYESLRRRAIDKTIPAFRMGGRGHWKILEADLIKYIRGQYGADVVISSTERTAEP